MSRITDTIETFKKQLEKAELFRAKYDSKIPEGLGWLNISEASIMFLVNLEYKQDARERALTAMGDIFGRSDWLAKASYGNRGFDWQKDIDNVSILIYHAQANETPQTFPVDPLQFPLQLTEGSIETPFDTDKEEIPF